MSLLGCDVAARYLALVNDRWQRASAVILFLSGFGMTVWLGVVLSGAEKPPTRATSALLVVLAGGLQLGSAIAMSRAGRADPALARASARRLLQMGRKAKAARQLAEHEYESGCGSPS